MATILTPRSETITHFHLFCGMGGGALGFNAGGARVGNATATMQCVGGIDSDPDACRDFTRLVGTNATCLDLFDAGQYEAFHGEPPPEGWEEATPADVRRAAHNVRPDIVFQSSPCKGFSGLLALKNAPEPGTAAWRRVKKYAALNELSLRGMWLLLQAWKDDPVPLIVFENVPLIQKRGRHFLDQIDAMLECAGYSVAHTTHDCGEVGGLAQHRKRFLLVARHREKVPPFLYEPPRQRVKAVGEVLGEMPLPESEGTGRIHQVSRLKFLTWTRLALIEAGGDWRTLQKLEVNEDGHLANIGLVSLDAGQPVSIIDDPRTPNWTSAKTGRRSEYGQYGILTWDNTSGAVTSKAHPGTGRFSIADPRLACDVNDLKKRRFNNTYRLVRWDHTSPCVTGAMGANQAVADPRWNWTNKDGRAADRYGVVRWEDSTRTLAAHASHDNGYHSVADPRPLYQPSDRPDPIPVIISLDNTWHRPFTTLELAALQGFDWQLLVDRGLAGSGHTSWRGHIGNAVPPLSAKAIASEMAETLLLARAGTTFQLSAKAIWVQGLTTALSIDIPAA